jgi:hypothetical protein
MMRRYSTILRSLVCLALVATAAWAEEKVPNDVPGEGIVANCDLTGYKSEVRTFNPGIAVPDNNPAGVTTPAIQFAADGSTIADVVIDILMTHTWIGDIVATVQYDETCDGTVDATSVVICRPRGPLPDTRHPVARRQRPVAAAISPQPAGCCSTTAQ